MLLQDAAQGESGGRLSVRVDQQQVGSELIKAGERLLGRANRLHGGPEILRVARQQGEPCRAVASGQEAKLYSLACRDHLHSSLRGALSPESSTGAAFACRRRVKRLPPGLRCTRLVHSTVKRSHGPQRSR